MSARKNNRVSYRKSAAIIRASDVLHNVSQISFFKWTIGWIVTVSMICACFLMHYEGDNDKNNLSWEDAIFLSAGAVTATGLNSFDITLFSKASLNTIMIATQLGSATLTSLVPVVIRIRYLRQVIPRNYRTFNLNNFKRVPEWLVEYKALVYLVRIVLVTNLIVYLFYGGLLYYFLTSTEDSMAVLSNTDNTAAAANTPFYWTLFHTISAYNNCGFSLQRDSFASFDSNLGILYCLNMLVLHGNVLFPIFLRWIIIWLSALTPKSRSSKVYFRYLLLNGRHLYSNLFGSQQTWLLLLQQLLLVTVQVVFTVWLTPRHPTFSVALFEAVNVRHAGFNAIPLPDLSSGILIMFVSFMYLAPMPYIAMLKASMCEAPTADSILGLSVGGSEDSATLLATPSASTGVHSNTTQNTQNSRKLSLNMARDNLRENLVKLAAAEEGGTMSSIQLWNEKATLRSELSSVTRKSIKEKVVTNEMLDTRLLILTMFSESAHVPWKDRITLRVKAVSFQAKKLWASFCSGIKPDMFLIWFVWWIICSMEEFSAESPAVFNTLFEIVSSFGNVGLSLGSFSEPASPCSFALDLAWYSKLMLVFVQIAGRTRDLPSKVDSVLTVSKPVDAKEILTERWLHFSSQQSPEEGNSDEEEGEGEFGNGSTGRTDQDRSFTSSTSIAENNTDVGSSAEGTKEEEEGVHTKKKGGNGKEDSLSVPLLRDFNGRQAEKTQISRVSRVTFSEE